MQASPLPLSPVHLRHPGREHGALRCAFALAITRRQHAQRAQNACHRKRLAGCHLGRCTWGSEAARIEHLISCNAAGLDAKCAGLAKQLSILQLAASSRSGQPCQAPQSPDSLAAVSFALRLAALRISWARSSPDSSHSCSVWPVGLNLQRMGSNAKRKPASCWVPGG